jgi:hypothetical protein
MSTVKHWPALLLLCAPFLAAQEPLRPFEMPWDDATPGITNLQPWQAEPAGSRGWITIGPGAHYYRGEERIRFLGVNIGAASAFPTRAQAEGHAARLARFGINGVRFHHMEAPWDKSRVLIDYSQGNSLNLSPERLDRFHYFVARLAERGIYSNINLLVSREFQRGDGLGPEITQMGWKDQHILGFFNDRALELHKEHARKLLRAPNPHRENRPLAEDPAAAFVEIMNENGLLQKWYEGVLDRMPAVYRNQLAGRWNAWLKARYASTTEMLAAWGALNEPLGENRLRNGDFTNGPTGWNIERHQGAVAAVSTPPGLDAQPALRVEVTTPGQANWHVQINQSQLRLEEKQIYTVSFWARAETAAPLSAGIQRAYGDYGTISAGPSVTLGTEWRQYSWAFQSSATDNNARLNFNGFGDRRVAVWLAGLRVQPGGRLGGIPDGTSLEAGTVPNVPRTSQSGASTAQVTDWVRFVFTLEKDYWTEMRRYIKEDLGYRGIVFATIIANSPPNAQSTMDAQDSHSYWQHPSFQGSDWDPVNWTVTNTSMSNDPRGGTLGFLRQRVQGMPHNLTEYQHSSPNTYATEGPLLVAAYSALQDWDSIWFFAYETTTDQFTTGFFDHGGNPGKMANTLLAATLFRRGDVAPAKEEFVTRLTAEREAGIAATRGGAWSIADGSHLGVPAALGLVSRLSLAIGPNTAGQDTAPAGPTGTVITSDTGELRWDTSVASKGVFTANTARTKVVSGFTNGRTFDLGGVTIAPGTTRQDWCTIGVTLLSGDSFDGAASALIVATGDHENTGQRWKDSTRNSVGQNWGSAPALIEVIPATVTLPVPASRVSAWALDARGQRQDPLTVTEADGRARLTLGVNGPTLWYEVALAPAP